MISLSNGNEKEILIRIKIIKEGKVTGSRKYARILHAEKIYSPT